MFVWLLHRITSTLQTCRIFTFDQWSRLTWNAIRNLFKPECSLLSITVYHSPVIVKSKWMSLKPLLFYFISIHNLNNILGIQTVQRSFRHYNPLHQMFCYLQLPSRLAFAASPATHQYYNTRLKYLNISTAILYLFHTKRKQSITSYTPMSVSCNVRGF